MALLSPYPPEGKRGSPPFLPETILRVHFMQQRSALIDLVTEGGVHDIAPTPSRPQIADPADTLRPLELEHGEDLVSGPKVSNSHELFRLRACAGAIVIGMASLLGLPSWGAAPISAVPLVELSASSVREYYAKRGDTAEAARIVGFAPAELEAQVPLSRFVLTGLDPKQPLVCVRIVHANNLYRAEFSFRNPANAPSVRVRFQSKYWAQLDDRLAGALAIRAFGTQHKQCDETGALLPATWGESAASGSGYLLVNGGQADSVAVQVGGSASAGCTRLDDALKGRRITAAAFTHACPVVAANEDCRQEVNVAVQRSFGPKFAEPDRIRLRLPCSPRGKP